MSIEELKQKDMPAKLLLILVVILITAVYISLIFNQNIWTDEAFTIELVSENTVFGIIKGTANDVHPPLYYLIVKAFVTLFGSNFQVYKLVSIIPVALTMFLSVLYVKPWFGTKAALLFLLFFNAIPSVMEYGVQIRMYSWSIFFITVTGLSAYGVYTKERLKYWYIMTLSALCACYTHNFAMISAVFIYVLLGIALMLKKKSVLAKWLLSGMIVGICFLPWLFVLLRQTSVRVDNYWIPPVTVSTVKGYFSDLYGSRLPFTEVLFAALLIAAVVSLAVLPKSKREMKYYAAALLLTPLLTALIGILVSVLITPFFIARYLIPCMGLVALAFAVSLGTDKGISFGLLCIFLTAMIGNSYYTNYIDEYCSTHTDELLSYMNENLSEGDIILYNNELYGFIYECYFDADMLCFLDDMNFDADYGTIWYFDSCVSPWLPDTVLAEHGLTKEYIAALGIEQNDFILYKIY